MHHLIGNMLGCAPDMGLDTLPLPGHGTWIPFPPPEMGPGYPTPSHPWTWDMDTLTLCY